MASHLRDLLFPDTVLRLLFLLQPEPEERLELRDEVVVDRVGPVGAVEAVEAVEVEVGVDVGVRGVERGRLRLVPVRQTGERRRRRRRCLGGLGRRRAPTLFCLVEVANILGDVIFAFG